MMASWFGFLLLLAATGRGMPDRHLQDVPWWNNNGASLSIQPRISFLRPKWHQPSDGRKRDPLGLNPWWETIETKNCLHNETVEAPVWSHKLFPKPNRSSLAYWKAQTQLNNRCLKLRPLPYSDRLNSTPLKFIGCVFFFSPLPSGSYREIIGNYEPPATKCRIVPA